MKKVAKKGLILLLTICMLLVATTVVQANALKPGDIEADYSMGTDEIKSFGGKIVGVVQTVGVVVAVVIMLVLGIKYMMGSAEEKAEYKKSMVPYIVGAILIFASTTIVNLVYTFANSLNTK